MLNYLLVDFGTTNIKTALVDLDSGAFSRISSHASVANCATVPGHYEVQLAALTERFLSICDEYDELPDAPFEGIVLCSEQGGFIVLSERDEPMTNYISWKDDRSLEPVAGVSSYSLIMERVGDDFKRITGWRPTPNQPIMNVTHIARTTGLGKQCKIVSIPEWLALCSGDSTHTAHNTMSHCLCFYDVEQGRFSPILVDLVDELTGTRCAFNPVAPAGTAAGYWHKNGRRVPIYVGIGDHQCSVLGACNAPHESISINTGTGSQVAVIDAAYPPAEAELRPYFDGHFLWALTRIPAGRALATFMGFLDDICHACGGTANFWNILGEVGAEDVAQATLDFDLAVFPSAWRYQGGGKITNIGEGALTLKNYLASLLKTWAMQYPEIIKQFDPARQATRCILSGGVARRLSFAANILAELSGYETWPACALDESLLGLRTIALVASGRASSCLEAQEIFGRDCSLR